MLVHHKSPVLGARNEHTFKKRHSNFAVIPLSQTRTLRSIGTMRFPELRVSWGQRKPKIPAFTLAGPPGPATSSSSPTLQRPPPPACPQHSQMGMADTIKAFPKKSAEDFAERLRLKSWRSRSSSDCCLEPPLGAMVEPELRVPRGREASGTAPTAAVSAGDPSALRAEAGLARRGASFPGIGQPGVAT